MNAAEYREAHREAVDRLLDAVARAKNDHEIVAAAERYTREEHSAKTALEIAVARWYKDDCPPPPSGTP